MDLKDIEDRYIDGVVIVATWQLVTTAIRPLNVKQRRRILDALNIMITDFEKRKAEGEPRIDPKTLDLISTTLIGNDENEGPS